ncbi:MAG TPA: DNRLRE domain-containing protein [Thermoanaerobaculia bacterium]|nr:DNRLRE domain-containing protein [Thermoanaerobaculia bacterium]
MNCNGVSHRWRAILSAGLVAAAALSAAGAAATAQPIDRSRGVDARVDYPSFVKLGPWDDRNYAVTKEDLTVLAANEQELRDPIPVFFRIEMRKANPGMKRTGAAQYPRSALQIFQMKYGGYLVSGKLYKGAVVRDGRFEVVQRNGFTEKEFQEIQAKALAGDVRVTSPTGGAESAVKIHPTDTNKVVAGSNGPGAGQIMWFSSNGGTSWTQAAALPQGNTCCDPTVDWSSNGAFVYTSTLGGCGAVCNVWVYRSADGGATWNDLATITPGDGRREVTSASTSDKQYIHVDKFATSPFRDNIYQCWHDNNTLKFSRSTDFANTWSAPLTMSSGAAQSGIGCDLTTDKSGNVHYFWPATDGKTILTRKSTNGGTSFNAAVTVANTQDGYDFNIPAMETRRAFIYASADADVSNGAFGNSIYAAWTDTTAAESGTAANNHGRIQVAFSRDGGASWSVRTPHETADASTVDRFHPWVGVGPDGKVYVMFYDTRRSPTRVGVDIFYAVSSDGGNTWATPTRLTSVLSPQVDDSFEWGDYNGLDVVGNQLITIFTDNRNEGGGGADSIDVYAAGVQIGGGPGNTPPVVTITAPANGTSVTQGTSVTFSGTATDAEDGTISGSLTWTSSLNGIIGGGASFSTTTLSVGTHTITASVTDSGGGTGSATRTLTVTGTSTTVTFNSVAAQDGRIWESGETGNVGGGGNATDNTTIALRVGDTDADEQYKSIVSFDTSSIPDGATILSATLRLVRGSISGTSPFTTHGSCIADIVTGGFGGSTVFAFADWQAAATATNVATLSSPATDGSASTGTLSAAGRSAVNKTGTTQLRVYCTLDDNDDLGFDYIGFFAGENATVANRPQLTVTYQ